MSLHLPPDASDRDREIATFAEGLARGFAAEAAEHDRVGRFPLEHYARLHEAGYLRLALPPALGGDGATLFQMVLAQEHLSQAGAALGVGVAMLLNVVGRALAPDGWPAPLVETMFRRIARDGGLANLVVSEPALGSISRGGLPQTTATRVDGGWQLNGHKIFVTAAPALRYLVALVRLPPDAAAPEGYSAEAIVEAPAPGLRIAPTWGDSLSQRTGGSDDVWFEEVFVPDDRVVGRRPIGSGARPTPLSGWWLTLVAVYLGVGQAALDAAADHARQRVPSVLGASLAELPHIQQWIGEMQALLSGARALLYDAARAFTRDPGQEAAANGARLNATKYAVTNAVCPGDRPRPPRGGGGSGSPASSRSSGTSATRAGACSTPPRMTWPSVKLAASCWRGRERGSRKWPMADELALHRAGPGLLSTASNSTTRNARSQNVAMSGVARANSWSSSNSRTIDVAICSGVSRSPGERTSPRRTVIT